MPQKGKSKPLKPWLTAREDGKERRFIQVGDTLLFSSAFNALKPGAQNLYLRMSMEAGNSREFVFPQTSAKKHGIPSATFRRHVSELIKAGFISRSSGRVTREENVYRFELEWKKQRPP